MARPYQKEELLRLRDSPLVAKPPSLPPLEEWMGRQDVDQNQKKAPHRGKPDDLPLHDTTTNRRPAFESRISRNAPEDIVLGPPKTAFASAAGPRSAKTFDSPNRGSFADDEGKGDRLTFRDRFREGVRGDRDAQKGRDDRPENVRTRDSDRWSGARQPRTPFGEGDRELRKNGDRDQARDNNGGKDTKGGRGFDNFRRNGDREANGEERRQGQGRGRNEPSWYRDDDRQGDDEGKEAPKRDWREKVASRGHDRDWNRGGNHEAEPEWLDEPDEKKQAHTQADFQRWKEKMKAGNAPAPEQPTSPEPKPNHERTFSGTSKKVETPLMMDSSVDSFFAKFGEQNKDDATPGEVQMRKASGKPSKFTGFFAPKEEPKPQEPPLPTPPPPDSTKERSNEDKEGFQRILKLLDQQQSSSSRNITPFLEQTPRNLPQSPPPQQPPLPRDAPREKNPLEALVGSRAPKESPALPSRDSEFLLHLMKQPQQTRTPLSQPPQDNYRSQAQQSSLAAFSNLMISPHETPQQNPSSGPPPGFFDNAPQLDHLQREQQPQQQRQQAKAPGPPGFHDNLSKFFPDDHVPPGVQRPPPGFDQHQLQNHTQRLMSQTFESQQRQREQRQVQPPPGFQHIPNVPTHQAFPPGLMMPSLTSPHHSQPPSNPLSGNASDTRSLPQQQQQFGGGQRSAGMPPPGFFGMNPNSQGGPPGFGGGPIGHYNGPGQDGFPPYGDFGGSGPYGR